MLKTSKYNVLKMLVLDNTKHFVVKTLQQIQQILVLKLFCVRKLKQIVSKKYKKFFLKKLKTF